MAEKMTDTQLLTSIKDLVRATENMELERVNEFSQGGQLAFCCGCICVSYCIANSSASVRDMLVLVEKGEIDLPNTINNLLKTSININK